MKRLKLLGLFRLKNQLRLANLNSSNKEVRKYAMYTISGYTAALFMFLGYVLFIAIDLQTSHNIETFFVLLASILFWVFGIWHTLSGFDEVIESKDSDFIFSLPIKSWQAKLLPLGSKYLISIFLTFVVLLFGYLITISFINHYVLVLLLVLLLSVIIPLLATNVTFLLSLLVRSLLTLIRCRHRVIESILTLGLFVAPLLYTIVNARSIDYKDWFIDASILQYSLTAIPFLWNLIWLIVLVIVTSWITIFAFVYFHDFLVSQKNKQRKQRHTNTRWTVQKPILALLSKEFRLYFSSLTYVSNTILTPVIMVAGNICLLMGIIPHVHSFSYDIIGLTITAQDLFTMVTFLLLVLTTTTSCSLSFEGSNVWVMIVAPIRLINMAFAKILLNTILFLPGLVLTVIVYDSIFHVSLPYLLCLTVFMLLTLCLISVIGFFVNLSFPSYTWSNDMEVVKQSKATTLTAVISMVMQGCRPYC